MIPLPQSNIPASYYLSLELCRRSHTHLFNVTAFASLRRDVRRIVLPIVSVVVMPRRIIWRGSSMCLWKGWWVYSMCAAMFVHDSLNDGWSFRVMKQELEPLLRRFILPKARQARGFRNVY